MIHSLHAFGLALDGDYEFDTKDLQGQRARVLLGVEQRPKTVNAGTPQEKTFINDVNFVEALYTEKHPEPADGTLPPPREPKKTAPANARRPRSWSTASAGGASAAAAGSAARLTAGRRGRQRGRTTPPSRFAGHSPAGARSETMISERGKRKNQRRGGARRGRRLSRRPLI